MVNEDRARQMLKKHKILTLENEAGDKLDLHLKPLTAEYLPDLWNLMSKLMDGAVDPNAAQAEIEAAAKNIIKKFDPDTVHKASELCKATIDISYPEWTEDTKEQIVADYFLGMFFFIIDLNSPTFSEKTRKEIEGLKNKDRPADAGATPKARA